MTSTPAPQGEARLALAAGITCYGIWGLMPLAFQAMNRLGVPPYEILAHRTIWAVPCAAVFVLIAKQGRAVVDAVRDFKVLRWLLLSAGAIAINWGVFVLAVNSGRVLETSLGYFINPLFNMAAAAIFFRETINRSGQIAILLAGIGVVIQAFALGHLPIMSLLIALSFCIYGVARKKVAADAQTGLLIECVILAVPALGFVWWLASHGQSHFGPPLTSIWLMLAGPITAVPLMLFSWAARRMALSGLAFLQFLVPSMTFMLGVAQGEPFTPLRALSFVFIWGGAGVFLWSILQAWRKGREAPPGAVEAAEESAA